MTHSGDRSTRRATRAARGLRCPVCGNSLTVVVKPCRKTMLRLPRPETPPRGPDADTRLRQKTRLAGSAAPIEHPPALPCPPLPEPDRDVDAPAAAPAVAPSRARPPSAARRRRPLWLLLACGAMLLGAGATYFLYPRSDRPVREVFPVTGDVAIVGEGPLAGGEVFFFEVAIADPAANRQRVSARGKIQADGSFTLGTYAPDDGVPAGTYKVVVVPPRPPDPEKVPPGWQPFDPRFARFNETPLEFTVMRSSNECRIQLPR